MPVFYVLSYDLKYEKIEQFRDLVNSDKGRKLIGEIEREIGARFRGMYFPVMGFGESTVEEWWELPNCGSLDKFRESKAWERAIQEIYEFLDMTKTTKARMLRSVSDVKVVRPTKTR